MSRTTRMTCREVSRLLPLHAGDDLSPRESAGVEAHVEACATCAAALEELRAVRAAFRDVPAPRFGSEFHADVRRAVRSRLVDERRDPSFPQRLQAVFEASWAVPIAATVVVLAFALWAAVAFRRPAEAPVASAPTPRRESPDARPAARPIAAPPHVASVASPPATSRRFVPARRAPRDLPAGAAMPGPALARIEIQTPNPNVRIIWLANRPPTDAPTPEEPTSFEEKSEP